MATQGKILTLFEDKEKTKGVFPRTKISAVSNENGVGLDAILDGVVCTGEDVENMQSLPVDADTLNGYTAEELMAGGSGGSVNLGDEIYIGDEESNATAPLNADTLGGRHADYYTRPYNLLDNSDFRNPVNQRGVTSYTEYTSKYTIDRWKTYGQVDVLGGCIAFTNMGTSGANNFYQYFPVGTIVAGKTYNFLYFVLINQL